MTKIHKWLFFGTLCILLAVYVCITLAKLIVFVKVGWLYIMSDWAFSVGINTAFVT